MINLTMNYTYQPEWSYGYALNMQWKLDHPRGGGMDTFRNWGEVIHQLRSQSFYEGFNYAQSKFRELIGAAQSLPYSTSSWEVEKTPPSYKWPTAEELARRELP